MKITKPGEYKIRNGKKAVVLEVTELGCFGRTQSSLTDSWVAMYWDQSTGKNGGTDQWDLIEPWTEPEELVPHWPAVVNEANGSFTTNFLYPDIETASEARATTIRLATELPPIMLPRRKDK